MQTEFEKENNYIIKNYRNMKAVNSRIAKLREAGVIRKKNRAENKAPRRTQPVKITYKGNPNKFERKQKIQDNTLVGTWPKLHRSLQGRNKKSTYIREHHGL